MHLRRIVLLAIDRQAAKPLQDRAHQRLFKERCLRERLGRPTTCAKDDERIDQRVRVIRSDQNGTRRQPRAGSLQIVKERHRPTRELGYESGQRTASYPPIKVTRPDDFARPRRVR